MSTRVITFAGSTLSIEYQGNRPARVVNFLYRHFSTGNSDAAQVNYRLLPQSGSDQLRLYDDKKLLCQSDDEADIADLLLGNSCYKLAYHSRGGLLSHAGGLAWQGQGLLLPGTMGAGKTTLTAWLLNRGFDYLTDEMVYIPHQTNTMQGLTRPLNLKHPSRSVVQAWFNYETQAEQFYRATITDLIPPTLFRPNTQLSQPRLSLIIFPRYQADREFKLEALSKAQAGLALMQCLVNARNLADHGFSEITRLTRSVPAYKMSYASFEQIGDRIETILSSLSQPL
jgi:hypothetical protein